MRQPKLFFLRSFIILFLSCVTVRVNVCSFGNPASLRTLPVDGHFVFDDIHHAAKDFGNMFQFLPSAVLYPKSVSDIVMTVKHAWQLGPHSELKIVARGRGHSLQGQAQAHQGVVIKMESIQGSRMKVHIGKDPYVDVSGGELWINILRETLQYGLTPKSWTDYLHLTVGGTLSNAGVSGQAFKHGPQISNVHRLQIVTGKGEVLECSKKQNEDLFYSTLGGLGQFGIITRARISLEQAPTMVKWIRVLYSEFSTFTKDQEHLISAEETFDYIEGFVIINRTGLLNNWRSSFDPQDPVQASKFKSEGKTLFCLEVAKYFNPGQKDVLDQVTVVPYEFFRPACKERLNRHKLTDDFPMQEIVNSLSQLHYIQSTLFQTEVPYIDFLDRVHMSELKLRSKDMWEVPHPWLNLIVPKSKIHNFAQGVFGNILTSTSNGPILLYPVNRSKWDNRTSAIIPDEDTFYLVAFLSSAVPSSTGTNGLEHILTQNKRILEFCESARLGVKQYLPHYSTEDEWKTHFGPKWEAFVQRKLAYDPLAILAPGQRIFH